MPLEATQHTARGAQAFAAFFMQTIDWGYATTSSTYMRHYYFAKTCVECESVADAIDSARQKGNHFDGDRFLVRNVSPATLDSSGVTAAVSTRFDVTGTVVRDTQGRPVNSVHLIKNFREVFYLQWKRRSVYTGWIVGVMDPHP